MSKANKKSNNKKLQEVTVEIEESQVKDLQDSKKGSTKNTSTKEVDTPVPVKKEKKVKEQSKDKSEESNLQTEPVADDTKTTTKKSKKLKEDSENLDEAKSTKAKKKSKVNRPPTAYNIFMKEKMSEIKEGNQTDKLKTVANLWKDLTEEVKVGYKERAEEIKEEFMKNQEMNDDSEDKKSTKKRLPNGYNIYLKDRMSKIDGENQKDKLMKIAKEWKGLEDSVKQQYKDQASDLKEKTVEAM
jgi:hypothetical protein